MSGKHEAAEVSLKLVVDSNARQETDKIRAGFAGLSRESKSQASRLDTSLSSNAKAMGKMFLDAEAMVADAVVGGVGAIVGLAAQSYEAFTESEKQVRGLASTLAMIDENGHSFEQLHGYANDVKDGLEEIAMEAGVTDDAMVQMFDNIIERGGKSVEEAEKLAEAMAYAGRAAPGGPEALAQGFEAIEMGMVRAKNPLVQMISATGVLKGSAKSVAKEMQKMGIDEQMKLAETAIEKMSGKMKQAPMTIAQMKTAMGVGIGNLFEEAGGPIVHALEPAARQIQALFMGNHGGLVAAAREFGELMADGVSIVEPLIDETTRAVSANWVEIKGGFKEIYDPMKDLFTYFYKNRGAIAKTFVDVATVVAKALGIVVHGIEASLSATKAVLSFAAHVTASLPGFKQLGGAEWEQLTKGEALGTSSEHLRASVLGRNPSQAMDDGSRAEIHDKFLKEYQDGGASFSEAEAAYTAAMRRAEEDHAATFGQIAKFREAAIYADADSFAKAWGIATKAQDEGAEEYVANFLAQNRELARQVAEKGPELLGEGYGILLDKLDGMHSSIADELRKGRKLDLGAYRHVNVVQNFQNVRISQDFRNQDPDRVAVVFRDEMKRYGTNRLGSTFKSPMGSW